MANVVAAPPPTSGCIVCGSTSLPPAPAGDGNRTCPACSSDAVTLDSFQVAGGPPAGGSTPPRFGHYTLATGAATGSAPVELGRGAMGVTYLARDTVLDCPVALKVIDARLSAAFPETRTRFLREAKAAASLRHPNVANVFHYGEQDGHCFYAMELVEGENLHERVRRDGPLPVALAIEVIRQVAQALVAAEARGIVHRDLKPANIMVCPGQVEGQGTDAGLLVKVIDFGLAKAATGAATADLTHGGFVGTPAYASPEQVAAEGAPLDRRSDIYSLGVTFWFLLTGRVPFQGRSLDEIHDRQLHRALPLEQLDRTRVPDPVITLLRAMLAPDPADRPQNARELADRLWECRETVHGVNGTTLMPGRRPPRRRRRFWLTVGGVAGAVAVAATVAWMARAFWRPTPNPPPAGAMTLMLPEKSVAVLPFENLSDDKANAFFADGMQEEILTHLSRVAELKVISRTSVMPYRDAARRSHLTEIARALGVTYIVEGSVQRAGNQIRVSAKLIDARTDSQRWAETYDRDLANVFALQSEIAERIAADLRAKLSPVEKAAIAAQPTSNLGAYDLYLQARELVEGFQETADWRETLLRAIRLLDEATRRDGRFALAWCLAAKAHDQLYFTGLDASPTRLAMQENAVNLALGLQPDLGEAHLARARLLYRGKRDYEGARRELAVAGAALPNSAEVLSLSSYIDRRLGRWAEALASQERAFSLDPRNLTILGDRTTLFDMLRLYREELLAADTAIEAAPGSRDYYRLLKAQTFLAAGQIAAALSELDSLSPGYDPNGVTTYTRVCARLYDQQTAKAATALASFRGTEYSGFNSVITPRAWLEALVARASGEESKTIGVLTPALKEAEQSVLQRPEDPFALALLGQIYAGLGRRAEALRAGRQAVAMRPVAMDTMDGPGLETSLAMICAWAGEPEEAMQHLTVLAGTPGGPDFGQLRHDPVWASLRGRADYQAMLTRLDPGWKPSEIPR